MTVQEFSDQFDVLYNNITSNQAPGLDEYEKSVFLTKALEDIIRSYFNPISNKILKGVDDNEIRLMNFSFITTSWTYNNEDLVCDIDDDEQIDKFPDARSIKSYRQLYNYLIGTEADGYALPRIYITNNCINDNQLPYTLNQKDNPTTITFKSPAIKAKFDSKEESKAFRLEDNILMLLNENVIVSRFNTDTILTVVPISHQEYSRLQSRPYKYPLKTQAWRLLNNDGSINTYADIIVGPNDKIKLYSIRYIEKPTPIIIKNLDYGLSIDGISDKTECKLHSSLHQEILQRAVELAKATYVGDIGTLLALGTSSQTDIGFIPQSK